ncbi:hypothetical protein L3Q82_015688 [Scortum barcoo]|uniref:Uncharacterized protein n=1 Tax=Scortum barcoo TaxID=214431 RepID=A0ACB8VP18_9TELE|nr:hypothetical protein L3Q82_015688 [Scortum barcoo]
MKPVTLRTTQLSVAPPGNLTASGRMYFRASVQHNGPDHPKDFVLQSFNSECGVFCTMLTIPYVTWEDQMRCERERIMSLFHTCRGWCSTTWPLEGLPIEPEVSPSPATKAETETPLPNECCLMVIEEEVEKQESTEDKEEEVEKRESGEEADDEEEEEEDSSESTEEEEDEQEEKEESTEEMKVETKEEEMVITPASRPPTPFQTVPLTPPPSPIDETDQDDIDGWLAMNVIKVVKSAILHLLKNALSKYQVENCYGCQVDIPSQREHQCMKPMVTKSWSLLETLHNYLKTSTSSTRHSTVSRMKFKKGDLVRISKLSGVFDKKYEQQSFTDEVFTVTKSIPRTPPVYKLQDYDGEHIKGSFYKAELQKVKIDRDKMYAVEKILKRCTVQGKNQVFPRTFASPTKGST